MTATSYDRGWQIEYHTKWISRFGKGKITPCKNCGKIPTKEGHDNCLGTLPFVWNACCGHGDTSVAYIQWYKNRFFRFSGKMAVRTQHILKKIRR